MRRAAAILATTIFLVTASTAGAHDFSTARAGCGAQCDAWITDSDAIWDGIWAVSYGEPAGGSWRVLFRDGLSNVVVRQNYWNLGHDCRVWYVGGNWVQIRCHWAAGA